jgi:hypothetical protein
MSQHTHPLTTITRRDITKIRLQGHLVTRCAAWFDGNVPGAATAKARRTHLEHKVSPLIRIVDADDYDLESLVRACQQRTSAV